MDADYVLIRLTAAVPELGNARTRHFHFPSGAWSRLKRSYYYCAQYARFKFVSDQAPISANVSVRVFVRDPLGAKDPVCRLFFDPDGSISLDFLPCE